MKTPLADLHEEAGARFVEFAGWEMPVHYGSQLDEHHAVRNASGCFDVSHMAVVDLPDNDSNAFLRKLIVGDVSRLETGGALYTLMLNGQGGVIDDLILYRRENGFRLVVNAGTTEKDLAWMRSCAESHANSVRLSHRKDLCIVAVQGPESVEVVGNITNIPNLSGVKRFRFIEQDKYFIARTGYTGEDGVEIVCPSDSAQDLWRQLLDAGVKPAGLGARDSLRLEAGLNLYGHDMTETTTPFESRLAWTIDWHDEQRQFIGKSALVKIRDEGVKNKLIGLQLTDKGIPREGCEVTTNAGTGTVTSGTFSPTLRVGIALARVPHESQGPCHITVRNRAIPAKIVRLPFVRP